MPILPGTINAGAGFDILLNVEKILSKPDKVTKLMQLSETLVFEDGKLTNPEYSLKNNLQVRRDSNYQQAAQMLQQAVTRNEFFRNYNYARHIAPVVAVAPRVDQETGRWHKIPANDI